MKLQAGSETVLQTLSILRVAGAKEEEGIALWFGRKDGEISRCIEPIHRAAYDMFHIPREGIEQILQICKSDRVRLLAQVHSHPTAAFHSPADDRWAIPRHVGALSIVIPRFALNTSVSTFMKDAAVYALSSQALWKKVESGSVLEIRR